VSGRPTDAQIEAALESLSRPDRFRAAESRVAAMVPQLQLILARALDQGGWFGDLHDAELRKAATAPESEERMEKIRTLLAEEARMGMLVGVAVGWELARELEGLGPNGEGS
jgi:hypothetical protein